MPGPQPEPIELSEQARRELEKLVARHTTGQQKAQRARISLKAAEGKNNAEIAREIRQSIDMVRLWRRWRELEPIGYEDLSADDLVARGIVASISPRHAARLLKKGDCNRT
jgi:hypothetical protein